ncbi:ATP-binding protein [Paenibacillus sp. LHD-117]|uniref:ATP-binding protein n=1 Tax=Paenibacillus sp. LHD-117 TaxID=3071412 RepID=UPI0027E0FF75|nr:ATP-binding protein [Paenibacillus sp. LHD-117]MDQ6420061.1 ATP-binding protein [Paenibacillus sp. LHD-117]
MAEIKRYLWIIVAMAAFVATLTFGPSSVQAAVNENKGNASTITKWQMLWEQPDKPLTIYDVNALPDDAGWFAVQAGGEYPNVPEGVSSAWIKFRLPELTQMRPAMYLKELFAKNIIIYIDSRIVLEQKRNYSFDFNELVVPLSMNESNDFVIIKLEKNAEKLGQHHEIVIDEFSSVQKQYFISDLVDVILGASLIFISILMMISFVFLHKSFLPGWNSLSIVMLSIGVMILSYSTFLDKLFFEQGAFLYYCFDIASALLIPSIFTFFDKIFGAGPYGLIRKFKRVQIYFSFICILLFITSFFFKGVTEFYSTFGTYGFGFSILVGNLLLIGTLVTYCRRGNREAIILVSGFSIFAGVGLAEMAWYFISNGMHKMFYWKLSILFFLASLIIILARRIVKNYEQAVQYSKQIEIFNNELQRSEKIEMISHLAASIAHEVRNPLQVTRGFLQLLTKKAELEKDKNYITLAIDELDRASEIITDFLTFAKPDLGEVLHLNIAEEMQQIEAILAPLATMQGGIINVNVEDGLVVQGNSSKFKQALINIIKNSIEAFVDNGRIDITGYFDSEHQLIVINIKDNGEGMEEVDLKRLGEPYYSKKSKGTGLGLMVTYRIIEAMKGKIKFNSKRGVGTQVDITFQI